VWLPSGGYHGESWRVLAGTGMAIVARSAAPIPASYDPLSARFAVIAKELDRDLGELEFNTEDLEEALGLAPQGRRHRLFLGHYTAAGIEHALFRYGALDFLRRVGYGWFRVEVDPADPGERVRVLGESGGEEHLLIELVAERRRMAMGEVLYVHWLSLRNPRARFTPLRPQLPGQEVPGLGLAREVGEMLALIARRLELTAVVFRPAHYHTAYSARHNLAFIEPARQGRFVALVRDLGALPLREATEAVSAGRVLLDGAPYQWEPDEMAMRLKPGNDPGLAAEVAREAQRCTFRLAESA
jgi:hypothetical protein